MTAAGRPSGGRRRVESPGAGMGMEKDMGEGFRPADHAMGLELQLEELQEQRQRARVQGRWQDARRMEHEIEQLQAELAATAELLAVRGPDPDPAPRLHHADELDTTGPAE